ncbi:MAG: hypothetical protein QM773_00850 [Hyphomonadaceae bacterium]
MAYDLKAAQFLMDGVPFEPKPFIKGWNRLEGRVREENFDRALRAEARDPLWFLARQWQFLELKADDAGSPIEARMAMRRSKLDRFSVRGGPEREFPGDVPLEATVEHEAPPADRVALIQIARVFEKALARDAVSGPDRRLALQGLQATYPFDAARIAGANDEEARQLGALSDAHLFDAATFLADANYQASISSRSGLSVALAEAVIRAAETTRKWHSALYFTPHAEDETAWAPSQLEYQFSCSTGQGSDRTVLTGDGYANGRLDWFAVDVAGPGEATSGDGSGAPRDAAPVSPPKEEALSFLPSAIRFAGMPSHRFWEMEDARVEFGDMSAATTDVAKVLLMEFILAYGDDWCLFPYEVETGDLCEALGLVVHDVFGDASLVRPADRGKDEDWRRWAMFGLETRQTGDVAKPRLFLPPTTPKMLEGAPIERVVFLRDEMANMVWAVERTVMSAAGMGVDGERHALSLAPVPPPDPAPATGATARYRLGTDAPLNWRPFVPSHVPNSQRSVRLQRARLPERSADPLGAVLVGPGLAPEPYFINEEEVPRSGRIVTRSYQRTRWLDGRVVLWLGRRTLTGRGEGSSGLEFDVIEEIPQRG